MPAGGEVVTVPPGMIIVSYNNGTGDRCESHLMAKPAQPILGPGACNHPTDGRLNSWLAWNLWETHTDGGLSTVRRVLWWMICSAWRRWLDISSLHDVKFWQCGTFWAKIFTLRQWSLTGRYRPLHTSFCRKQMMVVINLIVASYERKVSDQPQSEELEQLKQVVHELTKAKRSRC